MILFIWHFGEGYIIEKENISGFQRWVGLRGAVQKNDSTCCQLCYLYAVVKTQDLYAKKVNFSVCK